MFEIFIVFFEGGDWESHYIVTDTHKSKEFSLCNELPLSFSTWDIVFVHKTTTTIDTKMEFSCLDSVELRDKVKLNANKKRFWISGLYSINCVIVAK